jgi:hypothetical protein
MTGRERLEAAFSPAGSPETPVILCYPGIVVRDHWSEFTAAPWWHRLESDLDRQFAWRREVAARLGMDAFDLPLLPPRRVRERWRLVEDGPDVFRVDTDTGERERLEPPRIGGWSPDESLQSVRPEVLPETWDEIEELVPPPPDDRDSDAVLRDGSADLARRVLADFGAALYPLGYVASPLWRVYGILGFEGMMELIATRPALVRHAAERFLEHALADVRVQARAGALGFWIEECLTDMISPEAYQVLNLPLLQRLVAAIRAEGCRSMYYFCGNPAGKWDLLEAVGADALALEESKKGFTIDMADVVARAAGRYVVLGNLDAVGVLQNGTDAELAAEVRRQLAAGRRNRGRFIMSLGSPATPATPVARLRQFADLVRDVPLPGFSPPAVGG